MTVKKLPDSLHLVVFKDNLASRSFTLPLRWFTRIGWIFGGLTFAVILLAGISARFAFQLRHSDAGLVKDQIEDLESEIETLRQKNEELEQKLSSPQLAGPALSQTPPTSETGGNTESLPPGITPLEGTPVVSPGEAALAQIPLAQRFGFFPPPSLSVPLPTSDALPFALTPPNLNWRSRMLSVKFAFQYIKGDGGKQEGRFILLARGPSHVLTYPQGILPSSSQGTPLINPLKGEFFSVSRYREVQAEFGPMGSSSDLTEVQVLIFNSRVELILSQALKTQGSGSNSGSSSKPLQSAPGNSTSSAPADSASTSSNGTTSP